METVITLLIGHRGTGKSSFLEGLRRHAEHHGISVLLTDLDKEIQRQSGRSISDLWTEGEAQFRNLERKVLHSLIERGGDQVIALGAGFEGPLPSGAYVIWIRRETDRNGRIFSDRPRLEPMLSPLEEYARRHNVREHRFRAWAHEQLILPEGYNEGLEDFVLRPHAFHFPYDFTLKNEHFKMWPKFVERRSTWGLRRWELRDDLLNESQIKLAQGTPFAKPLLFSSRRSNSGQVEQHMDWPLENGWPPQHVEILSLHERSSENLEKQIREFGHRGASLYKLAVEIETFAELKMGHEWWQKDPDHRAFLPRSKNGRWRWYRSLFGPLMPIHYYREDEGSALDQPLLWQMHLMPKYAGQFAAVLGSPVTQSRSPLEHLEFFKPLRIPFVAIDMDASEFASGLETLRSFGLTYAAVTSPLKEKAFELCDRLTVEAEDMRAVNTLYMGDHAVEGHNTDVLALRDLAHEHRGKIWLWGGGGVRSSVRAAWPQVTEFSARTGKPHLDSSIKEEPDILVWAVGRSRDFCFPRDVHPRLVLDLNYGDDSPGLEWAISHNVPYQSGLKMFKLQAAYQREYWKRGQR